VASFPQDWPALCLLIFVLGLKHGLDADHLATIDGLTRCNQGTRPRLARYCGVLFSLGHGAVVLLIAVVAGTLAQHWQVPHWLDATGAWISIFFLLGLGAVNLLAVWRAAPDEVVRPVGIKGRLLGGLARAANPALVAMVGALFALSFDTISQASMFSLAAAHTGGWGHVLALGALFVLGMLVTDGVNGLWISGLIGRAARRARAASRRMSLLVGGLSVLVAMVGIARQAVPAIDAWTDANELALGVAVIAIVALGFAISLRMGRMAAATRPPAVVNSGARSAGGASATVR
jgi:high-affinity nickel-transport protein